MIHERGVARARVARVGQLRATRRRVALGAALENSARRSADCLTSAPAEAPERGARGALGVEELVDLGRVEGF